MKHLLQSIVFLFGILAFPGCLKDNIPAKEQINETPYYNNILITRNWISPKLNLGEDFDFIHADDEIVLVTNKGQIVGLNAGDGTILWKYNPPLVPFAANYKFHFYEGVLYIMSHLTEVNNNPVNTHGSFISIDATSGSEISKDDYLAFPVDLAQVLNVIPYEHNVLIITYNDRKDVNYSSNIYTYNFLTKEMVTIAEDFESFLNLTNRSQIYDKEDKVYLFATLHMKNENIHTSLNVIDLNTNTIKSIVAEGYPITYFSTIHYSKDIAIIKSVEINNLGHAYNINSGEKLWSGNAPTHMFSHLNRDYGFDGNIWYDLVHHDIKTNHKNVYKLNTLVSLPQFLGFHPEKHLFVNLRGDLNDNFIDYTFYLNFFDLQDGRLLIKYLLNYPEPRGIFVGTESNKIYLKTESQVVQFVNPL